MPTIDCRPNLSICKASCCKQISFVAQGDAAMEHYWTTHGLTVVEHPVTPDHYIVTVPQVCPKLDVETSMCTIHDDPEYPEICGRFDYGKTKGFMITEGCLLKSKKKEELHGIETPESEEAR